MQTNYLSPLSGFHSSVPLPGGQDVPKYLRLEEDEDSVWGDEWLHQRGGPRLWLLTDYQKRKFISNINRRKNIFCQVIDQHKENFNPDILEDFIDMFLLEVKVWTCNWSSKYVVLLLKWLFLVVLSACNDEVLPSLYWAFSGVQK